MSSSTTEGTSSPNSGLTSDIERTPPSPPHNSSVLCLNRKNRLIKQVEVTSGTATSSLAHPREVFREAIRHGATAVICAHNHPSGDPAPSAADVQLTRQLRDAARAVDIDLIDHVVLGRAANDPHGVGFYSFRQAGVI